MDHLRGRYARKESVAAQPIDAGEPAADDPSAGWLAAAEEVHFGLSRLAAAEREVLTLYFLEDLSIDEIAAVLGIPPGTVKSRLFHARASLRMVLTDKNGE